MLTAVGTFKFLPLCETANVTRLYLIGTGGLPRVEPADQVPRWLPKVRYEQLFFSTKVGREIFFRWVDVQFD
jgi:hypothetical protein